MPHFAYYEKTPRNFEIVDYKGLCVERKKFKVSSDYVFFTGLEGISFILKRIPHL